MNYKTIKRACLAAEIFACIAEILAERITEETEDCLTEQELVLLVLTTMNGKAEESIVLKYVKEAQGISINKSNLSIIK